MLLEGYECPVVPVSFSLDGMHLATGSWDKTVRVWDWRKAGVPS